MLKTIFQTRFLVWAIVIFTIINAIVFLLMGIYLSYEGILGFIEGKVHTEEHPGLKRNIGHIGFLGHGSEVSFRKIRIKELGK